MTALKPAYVCTVYKEDGTILTQYVGNTKQAAMRVLLELHVCRFWHKIAEYLDEDLLNSHREVITQMTHHYGKCEMVEMPDGTPIKLIAPAFVTVNGIEIAGIYFSALNKYCEQIGLQTRHYTVQQAMGYF